MRRKQAACMSNSLDPTIDSRIQPRTNTASLLEQKNADKSHSWCSQGCCRHRRQEIKAAMRSVQILPALARWPLLNYTESRDKRWNRGPEENLEYSEPDCLFTAAATKRNDIWEAQAKRCNNMGCLWKDCISLPLLLSIYFVMMSVRDG